MKIIVLEGLDKAGKATQAIKLATALSKMGLNIFQIAFPRYKTPIGNVIREYLSGNINMDKHAFDLLMAADKMSFQPVIKQLEKQGYDILLLDRYTSSQFVYGEVSGLPFSWLYDLLRYCRVPDVEILIDIPVEVSMARKGKFAEDDVYESDREFLEKVRDKYLERFNKSEFAKRFVVDGAQNRQYVYQDIIHNVKEALSL